MNVVRPSIRNQFTKTVGLEKNKNMLIVRTLTRLPLLEKPNAKHTVTR